MKSGNYLSSQGLTLSTFGVKELNFCVRNGNRWILFAIITAMVIYPARLTPYVTYSTFVLILEDQQLHSNPYKNFLSLWVRKNYRIFCVKIFRKKLFSHSLWDQALDLLVSVSCTLPCFHLRPINLVVCKGSYYLSVWDTLSWSEFHA